MPLIPGLSYLLHEPRDYQVDRVFMHRGRACIQAGPHHICVRLVTLCSAPRHGQGSAQLRELV